MKSQSISTKNVPRFQWNYDYIVHKTVLTIFKIMGLAPFTIIQRCDDRKVPNNTIESLTLMNFVNSDIGKAYNIFLIMIVIGLNFVALPMVYDNDYPYKTRLTVTIEMTQAILANAVIIYIWLLTCLKEKMIVKVLNRLMNDDVTVIAQTKSIRYYVMILFLTNILVWIELIVSNQQCYHSDLLNSMNDIIPAIIINWFIIQYAVTVKLIEKKFDALNRALLNDSKSLIVRSNRSSINDCDSFKISTLRRAHTELYEISCEVKEFYSLPMVLIVAINCYMLIYNAYYFMMPFVLETDEDSTMMIVNSLFWMIALMLPIATLSLGIDKTTAQMRMIAHTVHKILARSTSSREDRSQLKVFSLEMLHREVQFTAYGFFPLDCTLVHSIFSMVVTYLVILFQIQMAAIPTDTTNLNSSHTTTAKQNL